MTGGFVRSCRCAPGVLLLGAGTFATGPAPAGAQSVATDSAYIRAHYSKRTARIAMRDGTGLYTVVYAPIDASPARRYPILLQRTPFSVAPYGAQQYPSALGPDPFTLHDGYIFVLQEVRGRYLSEGTFENVRPLLADSVKRRNPRATDESTDAQDTIAWLLRNVAGHNGRVGLLGISYGGFYAAAAAVSRHPAIVAVSLQAPVMDFFFEDFHQNGALVQGHFFAFPVFGTPRPAPTGENWWLGQYQRVAAHDTGSDYRVQLALGALSNVTARVHRDDLWWRQIAAHPNYDAFWRARALPPRLAGITVPVLVVGGWLDAENLHGTLAAYRALRTRRPASNVSLVMGPFGHRDWTMRDRPHTTHGHLYFGDSLATIFQRDVQAPFFRRHLQGASATTRAASNATAPSGARVFDTGRRVWMQFPEWPAPAAERRDFFLHPNGLLSGEPSGGPRAPVAFVSDPANPVPSRCTGPTIENGALRHYTTDDQRCITARARTGSTATAGADVVVFQSGVLSEDVTFAGETLARIAFSTTGTDADVIVKLIDVYPPDEPNHPFHPDTSIRLAGYQGLVRGEIMRGRFRRSFSMPSPFRPGEQTEVTVRLPDVFHTFRRGHRIMVHVQGSWFPLFDRNPQRYVGNIYQARDRDFVSATHRVWTGGANGSRLEASILR